VKMGDPRTQATQEEEGDPGAVRALSRPPAGAHS